MTENKVKADVKDYLDKNGFFHFPIIQNFKKSAGMRGVSDRIAIKNGLVIFIEVKKPGGDLSKYQKEFRANIKEKGGNYIDVDDVVKLHDYIIKLKKGEIL